MRLLVVLIIVTVLTVLALPVATGDSQDSVTTAGAFYSDSVDLANGGKFQEALEAADKALAMNVTSMTALIQSNRAGILVMLHRDNEAITAADASLAIEGNLTTAHSIAWYNKGNALRALGMIPEAREAYNHAYALDNTLVPPDMSRDVTLSAGGISGLAPESRNTPAHGASVPGFLVLAALGTSAVIIMAIRKM